jgi:hypothetical protein
VNLDLLLYVGMALTTNVAATESTHAAQARLVATAAMTPDHIAAQQGTGASAFSSLVDAIHLVTTGRTISPVTPVWIDI